MKKAFLSAAALAVTLAQTGAPARAQTNEITIGITITTTGPAAALGIPERNSLDFVPKEIAGVPLKVTVLDAFGNKVKDYAGTVHFSDSLTALGLPANYTFTAADAGVHSFSVTLSTAGTLDSNGSVQGTTKGSFTS